MSESSPYRLDTPWRVVEKSDCFVIEDASGVALAHIAFVPAGGPHLATGQMSRSEALATVNSMLAAQERKIAIRRAAERIEAAERELSWTSRKLH
ncbi:hypothetical protein [Methylobacterium iners]|uniref:hypothetical protein n=1 Tax=Methylobacterium iners TaxID=418707 RepID=UPI001EE2CF8A|nr:hypothetical protein [Methylobacterium iners]